MKNKVEIKMPKGSDQWVRSRSKVVSYVLRMDEELYDKLRMKSVLERKTVRSIILELIEKEV